MFEEITMLYYIKIYRYCFSNLNYNHESAEDCTQEVFFIFYKNIHKLKISDNIKLWLYRTADNVIKKYKEKNVSNINIDDCNEEELGISNNLENLVDFKETLKNLSNDEINLLQDYYMGVDLSSKLGITKNNLYVKISRIRKKIGL